MAKDVLITPASAIIEISDTVASAAAEIEVDATGTLNIVNPGNDIAIGDTTSDLYIGDGTANVDIVFEQNGEVRALTGKTLTLGQSDSDIGLASDITIDAGKKIVFANQVQNDDHIQFYSSGAAGGWGIGVESSTLYFRSGAIHRWYINSLADGGSTDHMELTTSGLTVDGTVTADGFVGNADTADEVFINDYTTGDTNCPILFTLDNTEGYKPVYAEGGVTIDSTNNGLYAERMFASDEIVAGDSDGSVALTINDGYGNANIAFNHRDGTPDFTGSSYRIECGTDSATASMSIEMKSSTVSGTPVALTQIVAASTTSWDFQVPVTCNSTTTSNRFISEVVTGTAPLTVTSTTLCANLNADTVDGYHAVWVATDTSLSKIPMITAGDGVMEIGRYIDMHSSGSTADYDIRIDCTDTSTLNIAGGNVIFSGDITPDTDNTGNCGTATLTWANGRFTNLQVDSTLTIRSYIDLADSDGIRWGSSDDFRIFYDGTNNDINFEMEAACTQISFTDNNTGVASISKAGIITANGFTGDLTGTATTATNATNVYVNDHDTGDTNCPILFTLDSTAGNKAIYEDSGVYINSTSNYLYASYFNGAGTFPLTASAAVSGMGTFTGTNGTDTFGRGYTAAAARILLNVENGSTADQTAAEILASLKTVDVNGTAGVNAGTFDGLLSTQFLRSDEADIKTAGHLTLNDSVDVKLGTGGDVRHHFPGSNYYIDLIAGNDMFIREGAVTKFTFDTGTSNLTATTFTGALSGNATTATTATYANNVDIDNDDTGDTNCPIVFTLNSTTGFKKLYEDSAVYIDNTNDIVVAKRFTSNVATGTAPFTVTSTTMVDNLYAKWADTVDVNVSDSGANEYQLLWHSGDIVYASSHFTIHRDNQTVTTPNMNVEEDLNLGASQEATINFNTTTNSIDFIIA